MKQQIPTYQSEGEGSSEKNYYNGAHKKMHITQHE